MLDVILNYLYDVYERNIDIQVRFKWTPYTSGTYEHALNGRNFKLFLTPGEYTALWDNRITQHIASWDYEGTEARHGTRVTSLAEKPYFDLNAPSRREALGLDRSEESQA